MENNVFRKTLVLGIIVLFVGASIVPSIGGDFSKESDGVKSRGTLYVGGSGPGNYTTIQAAINDANPGDTVFVYNGTYYENVVVDKTINLTGEDRNSTIIDSAGYADVVYISISADWVNISGFTIRNGENNCNGIGVRSNFNTISGNNIISNNYLGIYIYYSNNNTISNNNISNNYDGIRIEGSNNNTILGNTISSNSNYGIDLFSSNNNSILNNTISNNNAGAYLYHSFPSPNTPIPIPDGFIGGVTDSIDFPDIGVVEKLTVSVDIENSDLFFVRVELYDPNNTPYTLWEEQMVGGTYLSATYPDPTPTFTGDLTTWEGQNPTGTWSLRVVDYYSHYGWTWDGQINYWSVNVVTLSTQNLSGIHFNQSSNNTISNNDISNNYYGICSQESSSNNTIYHNNLYNNTLLNAYDECNNTWDDGYPSGGNYWDDYSGTDADGDGIGDIPYDIPGRSNQDRYPLGLFHPIANFTYSLNDLTVMFDGSVSYDPDGYITKYAFDFDDGNYWEGTDDNVSHTYSNYGAYNVTLTVTDNDGLIDSISTIVLLEDFIPVEIIDNTPSTGSTGDPFTFNAIITDVSGVSTAWVEYWYGAGTHTNVSMNYVGGDSWEKSITVDDTLDILHYIIAANDTANNWNNTGIKDVTIYDNDIPEITDVQAIPFIQNIGGYVNISAQVIDNVEVDEVYLYIEYPDNIIENLNLRQRNTKSLATKRGTIENFSITQNKTGDTYYCNKTYYQPGIYTYHIWANDTNGNHNISADYNFEIINQPPYMPSNPIPEDNAIEIPTADVILIWSGGDPDITDEVQYHIYFGDNPDPPFIGGTFFLPWNHTPIHFPFPYDLEYNTTYYWKIIAEDKHGDSTEGPIWRFTTKEEPVPDLNCDGTLSWVNVNPGASVTGYFTVENIGESGSLLDWEIDDYPDWGIWTFTPSSGDDLLPNNPVTIGVTVIAPNQQNEEFTGNVTIVNKENSSDFCTIDVSLATPVIQPSPQSQSIFNIHSFIKRLMFR